ncbi:MAG: hypothetical protein Ta2B_01290 [Termitinemataceae bacterium]|nr:MAG: hypothetical protein Ta2B_01290 [Termitinemataceae bacterium]
MDKKSFTVRRSITFLCKFCSTICITLALPVLYAQDNTSAQNNSDASTPISKASVNASTLPPQNNFPETKNLQKNAIRIHIVTRVLNSSDEELSFHECDQITISGKPVGMKIMGDNIALSLMFTAYSRPKGKGILAAQSQVWMQTRDNGLQYKSTLQTVDLEMGKKILFFPLGQGSPNDSYIEIQVEVFRYSDDDADNQAQK